MAQYRLYGLFAMDDMHAMIKNLEVPFETASLNLVVF